MVGMLSGVGKVAVGRSELYVSAKGIQWLDLSVTRYLPCLAHPCRSAT